MNKILTSSLLLLTSYFAAFAAANDTLISFSTPGPDKYADGVTVLDGECYALVWTKTGAAFAGLAADGTAVGSDSKVVVFAPVAKGGRCPTVVFELDAELAKSYQNGSFGIYLCDTRLADGTVGGLNANGVPLAVNGYGAVDAASSPRQNEEGSSIQTRQAAASTVSVTTKSAVPEGTPEPQITAIKVVGDYVHLTVKGTVPCIQYAAEEVIVDAESSPRQNEEGSSSLAHGGDTPRIAPATQLASLGGYASTAQGAATVDEEVTLILPKKGESGFFKVGRK